MAAIAAENLTTTHMLSIGGWGAPHPPATRRPAAGGSAITGDQWFETFHRWNSQWATSLGFAGFDGIDWDLEGNDAPDSPYNQFSVLVLEAVGIMSQALKSNGYLVTMVPPESYLDASTPRFDLSLRHAYGDGWQPGFKYHGLNCYSWLLAAFGTAGQGTRTFDLVSVQLYESFSHADFAITHLGTPAPQFLFDYACNYTKGWQVQFSSIPALGTPDTFISVPPQRLVLGFSYGWDNGKGLFVWPRDIGTAYAALEAVGNRPRGIMYWYMDYDGGKVNGTNVTVNFAKEFNKFMHTRQ